MAEKNEEALRMMGEYADATNYHLNYPQGVETQDIAVVMNDELWNAVVYSLRIAKITMNASSWPAMPQFIHDQVFQALRIISVRCSAVMASASGDPQVQEEVSKLLDELGLTEEGDPRA